MRRRVAVLFAYTALIYAILPFARRGQVLLRNGLEDDFGIAVNLLLLTAGLAASVWFGRGVSRRRLFLFTGLWLSVAFAASRIPLPEERIHLLEYALLGGLLAWTVSSRLIGAARLFAVFVLGGVIGWGDEAVQWLLPDRVFDWRDVGFNLVGVAAGLIAFHLLSADRP